MKMNTHLENIDIDTFENIFKIIKINKAYFSNFSKNNDMNNDPLRKLDNSAYYQYIKFKNKIENMINNVVKNSTLKESKLEKKLLNAFFERYFEKPKLNDIRDGIDYLVYSILFNNDIFTVNEIIMLCHFKKINILDNIIQLRKYYFDLICNLFLKTKFILENDELKTNLGHDIYFINALIHIKEYSIKPEIVIDHLYNIKNNLKGKLSKKLQRVIYRLIDYLLSKNYNFSYESDKHKKYVLIEHSINDYANNEILTCPICLDSDISVSKCVKSNCNHITCKTCFTNLLSNLKPYCKPKCCMCRTPINKVFTYKPLYAI
jgi:hypothetical protein